MAGEPPVPFLRTASEVKGKIHSKTELTHDLGPCDFSRGYAHEGLSSAVIVTKCPTAGAASLTVN